MILKAERIADLLETPGGDPLQITPRPNIDELRDSGAAAIDLRLGSWFMILRRARMPCLRSGDQSSEAKLTKTHYVPFGDDFILHPRNFVLGVTLEWIRLPTNLAGYVIGRSSWGRRGLIIATATGVHPGFTGCLTLELSNVGEIPIAIAPGASVCQLFLHKLELSSTVTVDASKFVGSRKPRLGRVDPDEFENRLRIP
jgi:dCTP deaminase